MQTKAKLVNRLTKLEGGKSSAKVHDVNQIITLLIHQIRDEIIEQNDSPTIALIFREADKAVQKKLKKRKK